MSRGLAFVCLFLVVGGCSRPDFERERKVWLGAAHVQDVRERRDGGRVALVVTTREGGARSTLDATLDDAGFVVQAQYARDGAGGPRRLHIVREGATAVMRDDVTGLSVALPERPVVLLELMHRLAPPHGGVDVTVVDLASAEMAPARLVGEGGSVVLKDAEGAPFARFAIDERVRSGPGRFAETAVSGVPPAAPPAMLRIDGATLAAGAPYRLALTVDAPAGLDPRGTGQAGGPGPLSFRLDKSARDDEPARAEDRAPSIFLESEAPAVVAFAKPFERATALSTALALAEGIHGRLTIEHPGGPPSAVDTVTRFRGDCDNATALLVAGLRSLGHPARAVVGYRVHDDTLVPHAWAEVHDGGWWVPVDATVPGIGPFDTHIRLFEGLGSTLTIGRVLDALSVVPVGS